MHSHEEFQTHDSERPAPHNPHRRVVNAVLMQAADDIRYLRERLRARKYPQPHMVDAALWVESNDNHPFSFNWCCEIVGRDPGVTRKKMLQEINMPRLKEAMRL